MEQNLNKMKEKTEGKLRRAQIGILLRCCLCMGGAIGMINNTIGIYFTPIAKELGTGIGSLSVILTMISLSHALFSPFFEKLTHRFRLNVLMGGGVIVCILSYLLMSVARNVWLLYLCGILSGIGSCCFAALPVSMLLRSWFGGKNSLQYGIAQASTGVFGAVMNPVAGSLITSISYQSTLRMMALLMAVVMLPCALTARLSGQEDHAARREAVSSGDSVPLAMVLLLFATVTPFSTLTGLNQHFSPMGVSQGFSLQASATILSFSMVGNIVFKLLNGWLSDKMDPFLTAVGALLIGSLGLMLLLAGTGQIMMIRCGAFLYAAYFSVTTVSGNVMTQRIAGDSYARIYAKILLMNNAVYALMSSLYGMLFDHYGSYKPVILLILSITAVSVCMILLLRSKAARPA